MLLRPVVLEPTIVGRALPWDLYTASGVLIAAAGTYIADRGQLGKLASRPLYRLPDGDRLADNLAHRLQALAQELSVLLRGPFTPLLEPGIRALIQDLLRLHYQDPDACLGLVRLIPDTTPAVRHCMLTALVALDIGEAQGLGDQELGSLIAAALTMNIDAMPLHETMAMGQPPYTDAERRALLAHPRRGAELLSATGVHDRDWLSAVEAHHENMDGSGYPGKLEASGIPVLARILRVADFFAAKTDSGHYRPPRQKGYVLRDFCGRERGRLDMYLAAQLLRRVGVYPPGTLIRLANRETAVVARRPGGDDLLRYVVSFLEGRGRALAYPIERDVTLRAYAVRGLSKPEPGWPTIHWEALWGY
jgi:HD domain